MFKQGEILLYHRVEHPGMCTQKRGILTSHYRRIWLPKQELFVSSCSGCRRIACQIESLFFVCLRWTQPERDMRGLHCLLYHLQQMLAQLLQVHFMAQGGAEI